MCCSLKKSSLLQSHTKPFSLALGEVSLNSSSKHGKGSTRQIYIHDVLRQHLINYDPPTSGYLFASDRSRSGHITWRAVDDYWRKILTKQG